MKTVIDPVSLEIMWQRVISIMEECWTTIWRTSFSVVVGEALDFGCEVLDPRGNVLAHPWRSMPAFNFALPNCLRGMIARFPVETLKPGDVLITNDPWLCAGHLFDITICTPVFNRDGKVVAVMGGVANVADIGGTRARHTTREIYDEGLFIPPLKLYDQGKINEQLVEIIENNVRLAPMVMGDVHALVAANQVGAERILHLMDEYDLSDLEDLTREVQARTETAMRDAIRALPDGVHESVQWCDGVDAPFSFKTRITVKGDELKLEFLDVPPQLPQGGTNVTYSILFAEVVYLLKCILSPEAPGNDGDFRPITLEVPAGTVLNCTRPAAVNQRTRTMWSVAPAIMSALAPVLRGRAQAPTGYPTSFKTYGRTGDGHAFNDHMFQAGGQGASQQGDGVGAVMFPTSASNVSVEMFEVRTGFLVDEKEYIADSAGPGEFRGAPGQRVTLRRRPGEEGGQYLIGVWPTGLRYDNPGLFGGGNGSRMRLVSRKHDGAPEEEHLGGIFLDMDPHTRVTLDLPGGAGFGDPKKRDREAICRDVEEEILTSDGAAAQYGWKAQ